MVDQISPIPALPERNPNMIDPGQLPAPAPTAAPGPTSEAVPTAPAQSEGAVPSQSPAETASPLQDKFPGREASNGWTIIADIITAGAVPWLQATADLAFGNITEEQFEEKRQQYQMEINKLKETHPDFVNSAENAVPFLLGSGIGLMGKTRGVTSNMLRGAGAGATHSAVGGYTESVEEPTLSGERLGNAAGKAVFGMTTGAVGGAVGSIPGAKARAKTQKAEADKADYENRSAQAKKYFSDKKRKETKAVKQYQKQEQEAAAQKKQEAEIAARDKKERSARIKSYGDKPKGKLDTNWAGNMSKFVKDPVATIKTTDATTLSQLSRQVNMSPAAIAQAIRKDVAKNGLPEAGTPNEKRLLDQLQQVWKDLEASGVKLPKMATHKGTGSVN